MRKLLIGLLIIGHAPLSVGGVDLVDFEEDDYGAGEILYPNRNDMQPGDLDLLAFSAENVADGTWFTASFRNPIRSPEGLMTEVGQVAITSLARNDFYTFNIDVYIDTDMKPGSGRTDGLPGRRIAVDRATAWEKTVLLTPRPSVARNLLKQHFERLEERAFRAEQGRVTSDDSKGISASVDARLNADYFLPEKVRVRRRDIRFFVPADFLGGPASDDWAYTVVVTGAALEQTALLGVSPEKFNLMNMPVKPGINYDAFGIQGRGDPEQPPVVDYLSHKGGWQEARLADYNLAQNRYASLVGMVPSGRKLDVKMTAEPDPPPLADRKPATEARQPGTSTGESMQPIPTGSSLADRLRAIRELRDQGVLTEEEYQQIRRRIVSEY